MRTASNILTSAIGVNATGTMRGDRAANEREKAEPDEWDKAEIAWQEKSKEAEDFIAEAQKQLGAFQHSLSTARETLAVARKMATAEELEETFDPELDDATQDLAQLSPGARGQLPSRVEVVGFRGFERETEGTYDLAYCADLGSSRASVIYEREAPAAMAKR